MGIITQRRKQRQAAQCRRSLIKLAAAAGALAALAFAPSVQTRIAQLTEGIQAFSQSTQQEMMLEQYDVYALQLAVFDSGERAANELKRLQNAGVRCVIWQRERMRIVADAALDRSALDISAAKGNDAYVIRDTLEAVPLRLRADALGVEQAKRLLETPDALLHMILQDTGMPMEQIAKQAGTIAAEALEQPMDNTLYAQLAQSLQNWSLLMKKTLETADEAEARSYGAVTMCTLCRELRQTLSALSTASAQRTPSTAADVMPPA